jgi:hypothetical protein
MPNQSSILRAIARALSSLQPAWARRAAAGLLRWLSGLLLAVLAASAIAATLSPSTLTLLPGGQAAVSVSNVKGKASLSNSHPAVVAASLGSGTIQVTAKAVGSATLSLKDRSGTATVAVTVQALLAVSPATLTIAAGQSAGLAVSGAVGAITLSNSDASVVSATLSGTTVTVQGLKAGQANLTVRDTRMAVAVPVLVTTTTSGTAGYALMAWNDLGMHCMDADYSVFSILPPYNNLHAQLVNASTGKLVTSGVTVSYEAVADPAGSRNSVSSGKTNFWTYVKALFGVQPPPTPAWLATRCPATFPSSWPSMPPPASSRPRAFPSPPTTTR